MLPALVLGGLGLINSKMEADQQNKNMGIQNQLAAEKERTSYITGQGGQTNFGAANPYASMLQGGLTGAMSGMSFSQQYKPKDPSVVAPMTSQEKPSFYGPNIYGNLMNKKYNPGDFGL